MATTRTRKTLGRAGVGITVVALAAVGLLGYRAAADARAGSTDKYRTVTAAPGTVTQILSLSGTVHHVTQSSVSFPTSGRVTAVNVKAGDTVTAGQALASIDTTPLQNAVLAADAAYKSAIAQYETDQSAYSSSSTTTAATRTTAATHSTSSTGFPTGGASTGAPGGGSTGAPVDPTAAAVKAAEDSLALLKTGITAIENTLPTFVTECVPLIPTTTAAPTATVTQTVTQTATVTATVTHTATVTETATVTVPVVAGAAVKPSSTPTASETTQTVKAAAVTSTATTTASSSGSASATPTATSSSAVTPACQAAIDTLTGLSTTMPDQMVAANLAIDAAVKALNAKAALLAAQSSASGAGGSSAASAAQQQAASLSYANSAMQAAAAAAVGGASARGGAVTAATLITDQATIEANRIALAQAQDQLSAATITSPIDGKVASIPFVVGQQASATASAVIIGTGAIEVSVPVPLAKRPQVAVNQTATVNSTVGSTALTGSVTRISLLPTATGFSLASTTGSAGAAAAAAASATSTTYATVITVATGGDALPEGSRVQATIVTKTVDAKVVLPASAVTPNGTTSGMVKVLTGSTVTEKRVVTGAVGEADIEIVSGLNPGEIVVIADASVPIAAASINTSRGPQNNQNNQQQGGFEQNTGQGGGQAPPGGGAGPTR